MKMVQVKCYSGYIYAEEPRSFIWQEKELGIKSVEKAWQEPCKRLFKVVTEDGKLFELCYNEPDDQWSGVELTGTIAQGKMQNAKWKMQSERKDLSERLLDFAASGIKLTARLNRTAVGRYIANQLMRASGSAGANYEEACGAESRADFIHKIATRVEGITRVIILA